MKTQTFIIVSSIIICFILIGLLAGFLIKSNNQGNNDDNDDIFKEIPFKYKLPITKMDKCPLIDSKPSDIAPQCPIPLSYSDTARQFGIWKVDPLTDKSQSMCISNENGCLTNYLYVKPKWNWIIGTCKGKQCKGVDSNESNKYYYNAYTDAKNHGTDLIVNYVGSYLYDQENNTWVCQQDSSVNMDGKHPPQDIMKNDQNWLPGPLPGGSANWGAGYYPAGRSGVGAPAFAFIISVEKIFNVAWYMLNQSTLDRGPINKMQENELINSGLTRDEAKEVIKAGNTWEKARSGEWDILESTMIGEEDTVNKGYLKLYANTDENRGSYGICLHHGKGTDGKQSGGWYTEKYFISDDYMDNESNPRVFFTIMDANGTTVFQIPTYDGAPEYWKGIGRKSAAMTIPGKFTDSDPGTGACGNPTEFCATFMPSCSAKTKAEAEKEKYGCSTNGIKSWCGNFIAEKLVSTHNVWGKTKAFGTMEWTIEMQTK